MRAGNLFDPLLLSQFVSILNEHKLNVHVCKTKYMKNKSRYFGENVRFCLHKPALEIKMMMMMIL